MPASDFQGTLDAYNARLSADPTAFIPNVKPSAASLEANRGLVATQARADASRNADLKAQLYGGGNDTPPEQKSGSRLKRFLHTLGAPVSAVAGLAEAALGIGTKKGLDNIISNVQEGGEFIDVLSASGVPNMISIPVGLMLDIAGDPLGGSSTARLIPRIFKGAKVAGLEGALSGARSGLGQLGEATGNFIPGIRGSAKDAALTAERAVAAKMIPNIPKAEIALAEEAAGRAEKTVGGMFNKFSAKSEGWTKHYEDLVGSDLRKSLDESADRISLRQAIINSVYDPATAPNLVKTAAKLERSGLLQSAADTLGKPVGELTAKEAVIAGVLTDKEIAEGSFKHPVLKAILGYSPTGWLEHNKDTQAARLKDFGEFDAKKKAGAISLDALWDPIDDMTAKASPSAEAARAMGKVQSNFALPKPYDPAADLMGGVEIGQTPSLAYARDAEQNSYNMVGEALKAKEQKKWFQKSLDSLTEGKLKEKPELLARFKSLPEKEQAQLLKLREHYKTEIPAIDQALAETLIKSPWTKPVLNGLAFYDAFFKHAKVAGNLPANLVNSTMANAIFTWMAGINPFSTAYRNTWASVVKYAYSDNPEAILNLAKDPKIREWVQKYPDVWKAVMGVDPRFVLNPEQFLHDSIKLSLDELAKSGKATKSLDGMWKGAMFGPNGKAEAEITKEMTDLWKEGVTSAVSRVVRKNMRKAGSPVPSDIEAELIGGEKSTFLTAELSQGVMASVIKHFEKAGKEGSTFAKMMHWHLTVPSELYSKSDQVSKLTTFLHATQNGVSEAELSKLIPRFNIRAADVEKIPGGTYWKLSPDKAMEIANEAYMNYAAMPGGVRLLRVLPLAGAPFISFLAGSTQLTGKALIFNPTIINKVAWLTKGAGGDKSPIEKEALAGKYYSWMDTPAMMKLPFMTKNPLYYNLTQQVPYYSLSLLQQPQRNYNDRFGGTLAKLIDLSPFFKKPEGQMLMDYVIIPALLNEPPQGMFGQPLFQPNAGIAGKAASVASSAVESVTPPYLQWMGLVPNLVPDSVLPYAPLYGFRALQNATRGKTSAGAQTKTGAAEKTLQTAAGRAGFPVYKMNLHNQ